ncbi:purine-nucleoside phosphorylase [Desulfuromonas sp. AOP6]|uniref:purine-nucleoside phosphorylase n=1 Tax=Desulfuromonas sp. AOP6 TaxID=1566351 RepID=UPI0012DF061F|nr:purine-nucleoside phosphorylase [Desulfuromonas sp. AOP6]
MFKDCREIQETVINEKGRAPFDLAVVLGSGLGALADHIEEPSAWPYQRFDCFPENMVAGHQGRLVAGMFMGWRVLVFQGRYHLYQGYSATQVALPARIAHVLGCPRLLLTNAVGGINPSFEPGDFMYIADHINLMGDNPLRGNFPNPFVDLSSLYLDSLYPPLHEFAIRNQIRLHRGVLCAVQGPSYETPAEIRAMKLLGADAVSMSTVPEAIMARYLGMDVVGLSYISNHAAGLSPVPLLHEDVLSAGKSAERHLVDLVSQLIGLWQGAASTSV